MKHVKEGRCRRCGSNRTEVVESPGQQTINPNLRIYCNPCGQFGDQINNGVPASMPCEPIYTTFARDWEKRIHE